MTAEVSVMNQIGVALAADSAVTIGQNATKIHTSADKLFQLTPQSAVGIMIYGNANFVGLPWETIIKTYRLECGDKTQATIQEYADSFFSFLRKSKALFPQKDQDEAIANLVLFHMYMIREQIKERLDDEAKKTKTGLDKKDIPKIVALEIKETLANARKWKLIDGFTKSIRDRTKKRYDSIIKDTRKKIFDKLPITAAASRNLASIIHEILCREFFGPFESGLVLAGFGDDEYLPSLINFELEQMVVSKPRFRLSNKSKIDNDNNAAINPFAQLDMVEAFMNGIQKGLSSYMMNTTDELFSGVTNAIFEIVKKKDPKIGAELKKLISPNVDKLKTQLFQDWKSRQEHYWRPVVQIVATLPKDELASMAEALVNLTKFRRRVTTVPETVGGPIDVAVITKGDGFVWIKRKHYFTGELNPRKIASYSRD